MDIVADAILVEQLVKLLLVDTVGALDLAVQTRSSRRNSELCVQILDHPQSKGAQS
jgi:hypothetical protein